MQWGCLFVEHSGQVPYILQNGEMNAKKHKTYKMKRKETDRMLMHTITSKSLNVFGEMTCFADFVN